VLDSCLLAFSFSEDVEDASASTSFTFSNKGRL
jgi:hypothetical protein